MLKAESIVVVVDVVVDGREMPKIIALRFAESARTSVLACWLGDTCKFLPNSCFPTPMCRHSL